MKTRQAHWTSREASIAAPRRRPDIIEDGLDNEAILLDRQNGNTYRLNQTALEIWRRCDGCTTTRTIARRMAEVYEVDFDTALAHVEQVIAKFVESGMCLRASRIW